jgi:hypothetical protein
MSRGRSRLGDFEAADGMDAFPTVGIGLGGQCRKGEFV